MPGYYLAGIIIPGVTLGSDSDGIAMLGDSLPTQPGDGPRFGTQPTIPGESETAIWEYAPDTHRLGAQWINGGYSGPQTVSVYFQYNPDYDTFYLSGSEHHDSCLQVVRFQLYQRIAMFNFLQEFRLDCDPDDGSGYNY